MDPPAHINFPSIFLLNAGRKANKPNRPQQLVWPSPNHHHHHSRWAWPTRRKEGKRLPATHIVWLLMCFCLFLCSPSSTSNHSSKTLEKQIHIDACVDDIFEQLFGWRIHNRNNFLETIWERKVRTLFGFCSYVKIDNPKMYQMEFGSY